MIEFRVMSSVGLAIVITRLCKSRLSKLTVNGPEVNWYDTSYIGLQPSKFWAKKGIYKYCSVVFERVIV